MQIDVITKKTVELEAFWMLRGIKIKPNGVKEVVVEKESCIEPNSLAIAQFLSTFPEADFVSVQENYRLAEVDNGR